jgi:predicted Zn-dependent protease
LRIPNAFRNITRFILICCLASLSASCGDKLQKASEFATVAEQQFAGGDLEAARLSIQKAIATRDDVAAYYILLGQIEVQSQKPVSAFNAFSLALDLEADNVQILQSIADLGLQTGRVKEAEEAADRILILAPGSPNALLVKGFIAIDEGRFDVARKAVEDILSFNAQDEGGIILSARIDALQGKPQEALAKIDAIIGLIGETSALNATRLEIYRLLRQPARMLESLSALIQKADANNEYQLDYLNLLYKVGKQDEARNAAVTLLRDPKLNRDQTVKIIDIWNEYDADPLTAAQISYFAKDGTRTAQILLTRHFLNTGRTDIAARIIAKLEKGQSPEALGLMAQIRLAEGASRTAYGIADRILEVDPRNEDALIVRSAKYIEEKRFDKAIADASIVTSDAPQNPNGYVALANALAAKGSKIRARQVFEQGMEFLPQSRLLAMHYKELLLRWGDKPRIVSLDKEVALASPSSTKSWTIFSESCSRFGDGLCAKAAEQGLANAKNSYLVDDPPGTPRRRGLFARITPEKICATTGGICTES